VNDLELMEMGHTRHDLRELKDGGRCEKKTVGKSEHLPIPNGLPLGWILHTAPHSRRASTQ